MNDAEKFLIMAVEYSRMIDGYKLLIEGMESLSIIAKPEEKETFGTNIKGLREQQLSIAKNLGDIVNAIRGK